MFDWFVLLTPLLLLPVVLLLVFVGCPLAHPAISTADRFSLTFDTALVRIATVHFTFFLRRPDGSTVGPQTIDVPVDDPTRRLDGVFFGGVRGELTRFVGSTRQKCTIVERGRLDDGEWRVRCGYTTADGRRLPDSMDRTFTIDRMNAPPRVAFVVDPSQGLSVQAAPPPTEVPGPSIRFYYDGSRADVTRVAFFLEVLDATPETGGATLRHDNTTSPPPADAVASYSGEHIVPIGRSGGTRRYVLTSRPATGSGRRTAPWRVAVTGSFRDPRGGAEMTIGGSLTITLELTTDASVDVVERLRLAGDRPFRIERGPLEL